MELKSAFCKNRKKKRVTKKEITGLEGWGWQRPAFCSSRVGKEFIRNPSKKKVGLQITWVWEPGSGPFPQSPWGKTSSQEPETGSKGTVFALGALRNQKLLLLVVVIEARGVNEWRCWVWSKCEKQRSIRKKRKAGAEPPSIRTAKKKKRQASIVERQTGGRFWKKKFKKKPCKLPSEWLKPA